MNAERTVSEPLPYREAHDMAHPITRDEFSARLADLCLKSGLTGFPRKSRDRHILMKSVVLTLGGSRRYDEREIDDKLIFWLTDIAHSMDFDHVSLRRELVDAGRLQDLDAARAWLLFEGGEFQAAASIYREILEAREDEPSALLGLTASLSFLDAARRPEAELRDVLERCVRKRSGSRSVRGAAAIALARLGDFDGARAQVVEGLLNDPESDEVLAAAA